MLFAIACYFYTVVSDVCVKQVPKLELNVPSRQMLLVRQTLTSIKLTSDCLRKPTNVKLSIP